MGRVSRKWRIVQMSWFLTIIYQQAKLMRVSNDHNGAIAALEEGTRPGRPLAFKQADMLVSSTWLRQ
jgi:hypothetical protein